MQRWQIGSEFHWSNTELQPSPETSWLPAQHSLLGSATAALIYLIQHLQRDAERPLRLYLPTYYCMNVPHKLKQQIPICWYQDLPNQASPNFSSLRPRPGDLVVAVNFFGIRSADPWQQWMRTHPEVVVIEDHSHDIASTWATQSQAAYCIASLYKTLPVPDGGLLWSPQERSLPRLRAQASVGTELRFAAMLLKQAFLSENEPGYGGDYQPTAPHRQLELQGIDVLEAEEPAPISVLTQQLLPYLDLSEFRRQRADNVRQFIQLYQSAPHADWQPLFEQWEADIVPFNGLLLCRTQRIRDRLRQHLIEHHIFPAIHWARDTQIDPGDAEADDLAQRILTIPLDQRYNANDVDRIMQVLNQFSSGSKPMPSPLRSSDQQPSSDSLSMSINMLATTSPTHTASPSSPSPDIAA